MHGFSYADLASNPDDSTSTGAFLIFLGANPISLSFRKQHTVASSSTEAEYHAIAATIAKLHWVKWILSDLLTSVQLPPTLFSNNLGVTYLSANSVLHSRMKHLAIDYYFVRDLIQSFELCVVHFSTDDQLTDTLTKSLSQPYLFSLYNKIGVISGIPS